MRTRALPLQLWDTLCSLWDTQLRCSSRPRHAPPAPPSPPPTEFLESRYFLHDASLPRRLLYLWLVGAVARCKYYFAWAVAESSLIFSGLCYNGRGPEASRFSAVSRCTALHGCSSCRMHTIANPQCQLAAHASPPPCPQGRPLWNRYINSRIRRVEFNASLPNLAANWNVCTGLWLRHCELVGSCAVWGLGPWEGGWMCVDRAEHQLPCCHSSRRFSPSPPPSPADVYERLTPAGKRPTFGTLVVTQLVSGVW